MKGRKRDEEGRGFLFGILWAAWVLHRGHGEDTYAEDLIRQTGSVRTIQRLARENDYAFNRGFWASLNRGSFSSRTKRASAVIAPAPEGEK